MAQDKSRSANRILANLSQAEYERLAPHLKPVSLSSRLIFLYNTADSINTMKG